MWLVYDPETGAIIQRGFADNIIADQWVQNQIMEGNAAARNYIICPDVEGFNE